MKRYFNWCVRARQEVFVFNPWKAALISECCIPVYIILLFSISEDDSPRTHDGRSFQSLSDMNINSHLIWQGGNIFYHSLHSNNWKEFPGHCLHFWELLAGDLPLSDGLVNRALSQGVGFHSLLFTYLVSELRWVVSPFSTSASLPVKQRW